jgi:hypothetical protein
LIDLKKEPYQLRFPLKNGELNINEYPSLQVLKADLTTIWSFAIEEELQIKPTELKVAL